MKRLKIIYLNDWAFLQAYKNAQLMKLNYTAVKKDRLLIFDRYGNLIQIIRREVD